MGSKLELYQLEIPIFIYKLKCQSWLIDLFHFCSANLIVYDLKWRQKYYFSTFIFSNSQIEILVLYSRSTNVNVNTSFTNSNFEGNLCYAIYFDIIEPWKVNFGLRNIYYAKNTKFFICVEVRILCKKVKYVWSSHFPEAITTKMQLGNDSFVFEYPVRSKQKISKFTLILLKLM